MEKSAKATVAIACPFGTVCPSLTNSSLVGASLGNAKTPVPGMITFLLAVFVLVASQDRRSLLKRCINSVCNSA